jgi:hypothetical protein
VITTKTRKTKRRNKKKRSKRKKKRKKSQSGPLLAEANRAAAEKTHQSGAQNQERLCGKLVFGALSVRFSLSHRRSRRTVGMIRHIVMAHVVLLSRLPAFSD